jgi:predicted nucleic acid-binding protein
MHLLARVPRAQDALFRLLEKGRAQHRASDAGAYQRASQATQKYHDMPMSLADACIVRMSEIHERHAVLTLDSDFTTYRKHGRVPLTLIYPATT